jgi:hypothetical protein
VGTGERGLALDAQRLAVGDEQLQLLALPQQARRQAGARLVLSLRVVEHHQRPPRSELRHHAVGERPARLVAHLEHGGERLDQSAGLGERRHVHEPHPVPERLQRPLGELEREPGLARAADAGERQEPGLAEHARTGGERVGAAHEARNLGGQVVRRRRRSALAQRRGAADAERVLERVAQLAHEPRARVGVLGEARGEQRAHGRRRALRERRGVRRVVQHLRHGHERVVRGERAAAAQALVEHAAEREHVGALVLRSRQHLLRAHVAGRARDRAGDRGRLVARRGSERRGAGVAGRLGEAPRALGEAEVQDLDQSARPDHDVPGLQVAVDDAALVRDLERRRHLRCDLKRLVHGERRAREASAQRLALDALQHQHHRAARHLLQSMDGGDVRVVQARECQRLVAEAGERFRARRQPRRQHLERHLALEPRVAREPDLAHAAGAQLADDLVRPQPPGWERRGGHLRATRANPFTREGRDMALQCNPGRRAPPAMSPSCKRVAPGWRTRARRASRLEEDRSA